MREHRAAHYDSPAVTAGFFSLVSLGAAGVVSDFFSPASVFGVEAGDLAVRLSLTYQPDPLNTIPTG